MDKLPDNALVVRGGMNLPENFSEGSGAKIGNDGLLTDVSVNSSVGKDLLALTSPNPISKYPGIPHVRVGVTTVEKIRKAGGDVTPSPIPRNPFHATLSGITPEVASKLFQPTKPNPSRQKKRKGKK